MAQLDDPNALEEFLKWAKGSEASATPESMAEAARQEQFLADQAARAGKPLGTLGDVLPEEQLREAARVPSSKALVPTQAEAGFEMVGDATGPNQLAKYSAPKQLPAVRPGLPAAIGEGALETTGRVVGEEAAPGILSRILGIGARGASKLALPATLAYEGLKSEPGDPNADKPIGPMLTSQAEMEAGKKSRGASASWGGGDEGDGEQEAEYVPGQDNIKPLTKEERERNIANMQAKLAGIPGGEAPKTEEKGKDAKKKSLEDELKDVFGEGLGDQELKDALETKRQREMMLAIIQGAMTAGGALSGIKPASLEAAQKLAGADVEAILARRKGKEAELERFSKFQDTLNAKDASDPTSAISQAYRKFMGEMGYAVPESTSARQLKEIMPVSERAFYAKMQKDLKVEQMGEKKNEKIQKAEERYGKYLEQDPTLKQMKKESLALGQVDNLLTLTKNGNTVSAAALGAKMARAMGEVGVLTKADVENYVKSGALARGAADKLSSWMSGKPTNATLAEIGQITKIINDSFSAKIQPIYDHYAEKLSKNYDIPLERAYEVMDIPMKGGKAPSEARTEGKAPAKTPPKGEAKGQKLPTQEQIDKYVKMHKVDPETAEAILTRRLNGG